MKKILFVLVLVFSITLTFSQTVLRQTASNYLKDGKLDKALEAINQCIQDASTAQDAKAWFIRGNIFLEIANTKDEKFKVLNAEPLKNALESYKKAIEFDPKKKFYDDIFAKITWQRNQSFNSGVDSFNNKSYQEAMLSFENAAFVWSVANVADTVALFYAAHCAGQAISEKNKENETSPAGISVGMSKQEVEQHAGKPTSINETVWENAKSEQWVYENFFLYFDETSKLKGWQQSIDKKVNKPNLSLIQLKTKAKQYYIDLLKGGAKSIVIYSSLADLYRLDKDSASALKVIRAGQKVYPDNLQMTLSESNVYIFFNNVPKALSTLTIAAQKDSTNYLVWNAIGINYQKIYEDTLQAQASRNDAFPRSEVAYIKSIKLKPDFYDAQLNIASLYFNSAVPIVLKANGLPLEQKEAYDKLIADANRYYKLALPYLTRADELEPNDMNSLNSLRQIYQSIGDTEKLKVVQKRILELRKK